jgi:hypothetical protein
MSFGSSCHVVCSLLPGGTAVGYQCDVLLSKGGNDQSHSGIAQTGPSFRQAPNEPWKIAVRSGACAIRRTRRRRALDGDLARFKTGAPGGWQPFAGRAPALTRCGAQPARSAAGACCAPTPPWPPGPKAAGGARRAKGPWLTPTSCQAGVAPRWSQRCCAGALG